MKEFFDYDLKYPHLIIEIIKFFNTSGGEKPKKTISDFVDFFTVPKGESPLQPDIIGKICDRLCEMRKMICLRKGGVMCLHDMYYSLPIDLNAYEQNPEFFIHRYNSFVYGFEYIYRKYKERTIPIIVEMENGPSMGSGFRIYDGIATARHCLTDGKPVSIKGYSKEQLDQCKVFVSSNPNIDIAFIQTKEKNIFNDGEPHVLENVLVMGYPKVPFFLEFCTGEKATISSMASLRLIPTLGSIASTGQIYFPKGLPDLLLITAKIRGGNSGGPVINEEGYVVGIATGVPAGEGISDDHVGYGMAYPIQALIDMLNEQNEMKVEFSDFQE